QTHLGRPAKHVSGETRAEDRVVEIKIHASSVDGRLDTELSAQVLGDACEPQHRFQREPWAEAPTIRDLGQRAQQVLQSYRLRTGDDERSIRCLTYDAGTQEGLSEIRHVHHVPPPLTGPKERETPLRDGTKPLHETFVARTVHGGGAQDHVLHSLLTAHSPHLDLGCDLAALIAVPGPHRRTLDDELARPLPVDSRCTAVNETTRARASGSVQHVHRALHVHFLEV